MNPVPVSERSKQYLGRLTVYLLYFVYFWKSLAERGGADICDICQMWSSLTQPELVWSCDTVRLWYGAQNVIFCQKLNLLKQPVKMDFVYLKKVKNVNILFLWHLFKKLQKYLINWHKNCNMWYFSMKLIKLTVWCLTKTLTKYYLDLNIFNCFTVLQILTHFSIF